MCAEAVDGVARGRIWTGAASLPDAVAALLGRSVAGILDHVEQTLGGVSVLWLGESRF